MFRRPLSIITTRLRAAIDARVQNVARSNQESIDALSSVVVSTSTQLTAEYLAVVEALNALQKRVDQLEKNVN